MLMGTDRHDFMSNVLRHNDKEVCTPLARESMLSKFMQTGMTKEDICSDLCYSVTRWKRNNSNSSLSSDVLPSEISRSHEKIGS